MVFFALNWTSLIIAEILIITNSYHVDYAISGRIDLFQANATESMLNKSMVECGRSTTLIDDPFGLFSNQNMERYRLIGGKLLFPIENRLIIHTFAEDGHHHVNMIVAA